MRMQRMSRPFSSPEWARCRCGMTSSYKPCSRRMPIPLCCAKPCSPRSTPWMAMRSASSTSRIRIGNGSGWTVTNRCHSGSDCGCIPRPSSRPAMPTSSWSSSIQDWLSAPVHTRRPHCVWNGWTSWPGAVNSAASGCSTSVAVRGFWRLRH